MFVTLAGIFRHQPICCNCELNPRSSSGIQFVLNPVVLVLFFFVLLSPPVWSKAERDVMVKAGFDWSLPEPTRQTRYGGLIGDFGSKEDVLTHRFIKLRWDRINPRPGVFDFTELEALLHTPGEDQFLIRLEVNSACEAPDWVNKLVPSSHKHSLIFWHPAYLESLSPLIRYFGQHFAYRHRIAAVQLGIGDGEYRVDCKDFSNKDGWGEFWMTPEELKEAETHFGFSHELLISTSKAIVNLYARAFDGYEGKLAFTNAEPRFSWTSRAQPYNRAMTIIADYVHTKGIGNRDGEVENWMRYTEPVFGIYFKLAIDGTCSLKMDEKFAETIRGRYWGTENELYGNESYVVSDEGPYRNQPYRFLISSLRALQMRRNFMSIYGKAMAVMDHPVYKTQAFMTYLAKTLGKQIEDTPDLFVLLGERYIDQSRVTGASPSGERCVQNGKIAVRSFGRWLSETSDSEAAIRIHMPKEEKYWGQGIYLPPGVDYEYAARKGKRFSFDVADTLSRIRCQAKACDVDIKLTYRDDIKTRLSVRVAEGTKLALKTNGDGKIKTATFNLQSTFNNGLEGHDFEVTSEHPLPIILVRVNLL